jgi:hypothetical protein
MSSPWTDGAGGGPGGVGAASGCDEPNSFEKNLDAIATVDSLCSSWNNWRRESPNWRRVSLSANVHRGPWRAAEVPKSLLSLNDAESRVPYLSWEGHGIPVFYEGQDDGLEQPPCRNEPRKLSARQVTSIKNDGRYAVGGVPGLYLQVKGISRCWLLRVKVGGRRRDLGLGSFPRSRWRSPETGPGRSAGRSRRARRQ